jgi:hypothetical protein
MRESHLRRVSPQHLGDCALDFLLHRPEDTPDRTV